MWNKENQTEINKGDFKNFKEFAKFCSTYYVKGIWAYLWTELQTNGKIIVEKGESKC